METIYGIQADTETLREAHEYQKRMQHRLQEQQSSTLSGPSTLSTTPQKSGLSTLKSSSSSLSKPSGLVVRSTSTSALPTKSNSTSGHSSPTKVSAASSSSTSPFLTAVDYHHQLQHQHAPGQLRSTAQSPAFLAKFYEAGEPTHSTARLPGPMGNVPWLSLPGAVAGASHGGGASGTESPGAAALFVRRRSDVGLGSANFSGGSTPATSMEALTPSLDHLHLHENSNQKQKLLQPEKKHRPHHSQQHHLLSHQELAALSRNSSPMQLNEALPLYLRKKSGDSLNSGGMERSFSSPGTAAAHGLSNPSPVSPFMIPLSSTLSKSGDSNGHTTTTTATGLLFPGKNVTTGVQSNNSTPTTFPRPEMERACSTGVLPMTNRPGWRDPMASQYQHHAQPQPQQHHQNPYHAHLGLNPTASASMSNLSTPSSAASPPTTASIFRTGTPLTIPSNLGSHGGVGSPFGPSGLGSSSSSKLFHPSKEVHA